MFQVFKVPGEINPADVGTKNLPGTEIKNHIPMLHVRDSERHLEEVKKVKGEC